MAEITEEQQKILTENAHWWADVANQYYTLAFRRLVDVHGMQTEMAKDMAKHYAMYAPVSESGMVAFARHIAAYCAVISERIAEKKHD
jgi:hypothetical protein